MWSFRSHVLSTDGLLEKTVAQSHQRYAGYDACGNVGNEVVRLATLQHLQTFVGKGGEGGEATTKACREQQTPGVGMCTQSAGYAKYATYEQASSQVLHTTFPTGNQCRTQPS